MAEHVSSSEFERWMKHLSDQNKEILVEQRKTNGRVTALEVEQKITKRIAAYISGTVAFVITIAGLLISYFKG